MGEKFQFGNGWSLVTLQCNTHILGIYPTFMEISLVLSLALLSIRKNKLNDTLFFI